jgi:hypothetical protein
VSVASNANAAVASAVVSGAQIAINGYVAGSTSMTICASNIGCAVLYVTVQQGSVTTSSATSNVISFSQNTVNVTAGQSQNVSLYGPGSYYVSANNNPNLVSASVNGPLLLVTGLNSGSTILNVCGSGNNTTSCGNITVNVSASGQTNNTSTASNISFSQSDVSLTLGESKSVTVSASGIQSFYISKYPDPPTVEVTLSGTNISLRGATPGGANIPVCQLGGTCRNLYVYVSQSGSTVTLTGTPAVSNQPLALSSFGLASNNVNSTFTGVGVALTVTVSANQSITAPTIVFAGQTLPAFGSGSGPYTAVYTLTGREAQPISIAITLRNSAGATAQSVFSIGSAPAASVTTVADAAASFGSGVSVFTKALELGSTGVEVTALQTRLTALGFYSGPITGKFGALTEASVKKYQAKHSLPQAGAVGPATRALLNKGI